MRTLLLAMLVLCVSPDVGADEPVLVFSLRKWEGEYESQDISGGA